MTGHMTELIEPIDYHSLLLHRLEFHGLLQCLKFVPPPTAYSLDPISVFTSNRREFVLDRLDSCLINYEWKITHRKPPSPQISFSIYLSPG